MSQGVGGTAMIGSRCDYEESTLGDSRDTSTMYEAMSLLRVGLRLKDDMPRGGGGVDRIPAKLHSPREMRGENLRPVMERCPPCAGILLSDVVDRVETASE